MTLDGRHARTFPNIKQLCDDEMESNYPLQSLDDDQIQDHLNFYAITVFAGNIVKDAFDMAREYMLSHGVDEKDVFELMLDIKTELE
jgi:hypothetical protein